MKIAIIGAGVGGMAAAGNALRRRRVAVVRLIALPRGAGLTGRIDRRGPRLEAQPLFDLR